MADVRIDEKELGAPSRRTVIRENEERRRSFGHGKGRIVTGCRCWACYWLRTRACASIDEAIAVNGHRALDCAVAIVKQCPCQLTRGPRDVFYDINRHYGLPRKRFIDVERARQLVQTCCGFCKDQFYRLLGHDYRLFDPLFSIGFIFECDHL